MALAEKIEFYLIHFGDDIIEEKVFIPVNCSLAHSKTWPSRSNWLHTPVILTKFDELEREGGFWLTINIVAWATAVQYKIP